MDATACVSGRSPDARGFAGAARLASRSQWRGGDANAAAGPQQQRRAALAEDATFARRDGAQAVAGAAIPAAATPGGTAVRGSLEAAGFAPGVGCRSRSRPIRRRACRSRPTSRSARRRPVCGAKRRRGDAGPARALAPGARRPRRLPRAPPGAGRRRRRVGAGSRRPAAGAPVRLSAAHRRHHRATPARSSIRSSRTRDPPRLRVVS